MVEGEHVFVYVGGVGVGVVVEERGEQMLMEGESSLLVL